MWSEQQNRLIFYLIQDARFVEKDIEGLILGDRLFNLDDQEYEEIVRTLYSLETNLEIHGGNLAKSMHWIVKCILFYVDFIYKNHFIYADENITYRLLEIVDCLSRVIDALQGAFEHTRENDEKIAVDAQFIFDDINQRIISDSKSQNIDISSIENSFPTYIFSGHSQIKISFKYEVSQILEKIRAQLDGYDDDNSRKELKDICEELKHITGTDQFSAWNDLVEAFQSAIQNYNNSYSVLKPIIIRDIQESEALILDEKSNQIKIKDDLRKLTLPARVFFQVELFLEKTKVHVGQEIEIFVCLKSEVSEQEHYSHLFQIPLNSLKGMDLDIFVSASGFLGNKSVLSMPLDAYMERDMSESLIQESSLKLIAVKPGKSKIQVEFFCENTFKGALNKTVKIIGVNDNSFLQRQIYSKPRHVPQPDLVLQAQSIWNTTHSVCRFQYQLRSFRFPSLFPSIVTYCSDDISTQWLDQSQSYLTNTLVYLSDSLATDHHYCLAALGHHLFQNLIPADLQADLQILLQVVHSLSVLVLANQDTWLPWNLLHNGEQFLGETIIFGHWLHELSNQRPYEFPVGAINLSRYANSEQPQLWQSLLEPPGAPPSNVLPSGIFDDLSTTEAMRGLHLLRKGRSPDAANRDDAPIPLDTSDTETNPEDDSAQSLDQKLRPAKLNLRRNRPLVSLGYLHNGQAELTTLETTWAPAFIRAGASAFVGTRWAINPAVEAAFISTFYQRLWLGDSLGTAFHTARTLARTAVPDSCDWLAYVLYGDPMARPYRPVEGKGYAVVEPIGRDIDDPLPANTPARFRLSLRRTPPVWHEERVIEVAQDLSFDNLQVHVLTFGLDVTPTPVTMTQAPNGNYLGWFTLTAPPDAIGTAVPVQVHFMDDTTPIHSLTFSLTVTAQGAAPTESPAEGPGGES